MHIAHTRSHTGERGVAPMQKPPIQHDTSHEPGRSEQPEGQGSRNPDWNDVRQQMGERTVAESPLEMPGVRLQAIAGVMAVRLDNR